MEPMAEEVRRDELEYCTVRVVKPEHIVTHDVRVKELDLCTMAASEQDFTADFTLTAKPAADGGADTGCVEVAAVVLWFDTEFSARVCPEAPVTLSTSWASTPTHWAQTVLTLKEPVRLALPSSSGGGGGEPCAPCIMGRLSMVRHAHKHRYLDISLDYSAEYSDGRRVRNAAMYSMAVEGRERKEAPARR
eukprot:366534-Chlamydomonas_euryale.AAC.10